MPQMHNRSRDTRWLRRGFLALCSFLLFLQWLPGTRFPVVSDTAVYALLGRSVWTTGSYSFLGLPYAKHLPLHPIVSYPFTALLGPHLGMQLSSLLAGVAVLIATFLLVRRVFGQSTAMIATGLLTMHHGFVLMTMFGSADLLFCALFLFSIYFFVRAEENTRWYLFAGLFAGLACLTRYNGLPIFPLFFGWVLWRRRHHLQSPHLWAGGAIAIGIFSLWLIRNAITLGSPFANEYTGELGEKSSNLLSLFFTNAAYYAHPLHNILPLPLLFALYGLWRAGKRQMFLVCAMAAGWVLALLWWVQAIRFAFPGYPILLGFAAIGFVDLYRRITPSWRLALVLVVAPLTLGMQVAVNCLYDYGSCNAWLDRHIPGFPQNLGLSTEGFHSWDLARRELHARAESGATIVITNLWDTWFAEGVYRADLHVLDSEAADIPCPHYRIVQEAGVGQERLFTSPSPAFSLVRDTCSGSNEAS